MRVILNGKPFEAAQGTTVAAAILAAGLPAMRRSVTGQPRGPLCGMGICFECRATIDGHPHARTCQILCHPEMDIRTDD
jgi:hypothetical protein